MSGIAAGASDLIIALDQPQSSSFFPLRNVCESLELGNVPSRGNLQGLQVTSEQGAGPAVWTGHARSWVATSCRFSSLCNRSKVRNILAVYLVNGPCRNCQKSCSTYSMEHSQLIGTNVQAISTKLRLRWLNPKEQARKRHTYVV